MKKVLTLFVALIMALALSACVGTPTSSTASVSLGDASSISAPSQADPVSPTTELSGEGNLGDYYVKIVDFMLAEDYEGNPAIVITYEFTNNGAEAANFMFSTSTKAFQDGIELSTAVLMGVDGYDSESSMKDIKTGATITVQNAFLLDSETSPVEIEVTELISFNTAMVAKTFEIVYN